MRGKKWYWCLISYLLDVSINNTWQLHKICSKGNPMDMLQFCRYIVRTYLMQYGKLPLQGVHGRAQNVLHDIRYDGINHWVIPQDKQTWCAHCHAKTTTRCEKCDISLHVNCFKEFTVTLAFCFKTMLHSSKHTLAVLQWSTSQIKNIYLECSYQRMCIVYIRSRTYQKFFYIIEIYLHIPVNLLP